MKCYILIYDHNDLGEVVYKTLKDANEAKVAIEKLYGTKIRIATMIEKVKK